MAKAVLVIDVPECTCTYCPIYNMGDSDDDYRDLWCSKGCLLRPLPKEKDNRLYISNHPTNEIDIEEDEFANGWNSCLAEITGETE